MRRRDLLAALSVGAVLQPLATLAHSILLVVGYVNAASPTDAADLLAAFKRGLSEAGYNEGRNVLIEYRWAEGHYDRLPALIDDLVRLQVNVIAATSSPVALAAKAATATIPVAFTVGGDPMRLGLAASLARPGGNLTGVTRYNVEWAPKRLQLLIEAIPGATRIGLLVNPRNPNTEALVKSVDETASVFRVEILLVKADDDQKLDVAFANLSRDRAAAVIIGNDPFFNSRTARLAQQALRYSLPAVYQYRAFIEAGGLMSYGASNTDSHRRLGAYVGRILSGTKPADLPIEQSTKVDLLLNLKSARAFGLAVSPALLARADEVIE